MRDPLRVQNAMTTQIFTQKSERALGQAWDDFDVLLKI